jgi:hypothetical protein
VLGVSAWFHPPDFIRVEFRSFPVFVVFQIESFPVDLVGPGTGIVVARTKAIDPFLTDVKASATFAVENDDTAIFPGTTGCSVPDFQRDAVLRGVAAILMENFTAGRIGTRENQWGHRHRESALSSDQEKSMVNDPVKSNRSRLCNAVAGPR